MNFQGVVDGLLAGARSDELKKLPVLSLGEIILKLEAIQERYIREKENNSDAEEPSVRFDFEYLVPTTLDSWRGVYAELALGFADPDSSRGVSAPKLSELLAELRSAVGKTFTGYKGGDFTMGRRTPVWVANYGNSGSTAIVDLIDRGYGWVTLQTWDVGD